MNNYSGKFLNKLVLVFILAIALGLTGHGGGGGGSDPASTPDATPTSTPTPLLQQNPSSLFLPNTSPLQTVADVQAILAAETAITKGVYTSCTSGSCPVLPLLCKDNAAVDSNSNLNLNMKSHCRITTGTT